MGSPSNFIFLPEAMAVVTGDLISQSSLWGRGEETDRRVRSPVPLRATELS